MHRDGLGVKRDMAKAVAYFEAAAQAGSAYGSADAWVNLGKIHVGT